MPGPGVVLPPVVGPLLLAAFLFLMFQAVLAWAEVPMQWIETATAWLAAGAGTLLPAGWASSLLVDGVIAGAGSVLAFLPQIVILFFFILLLEDSGYLPRAAFLLDRLMGAVGLSGRSFIPLLSSHACAVPGIMAARTIADPRDRLVTIMIAPLMTCSARLPVYTQLIGAFIPQRVIGGWIELQGLVLLFLYAAGILGAMLVAWVLKRFTAAGRHVRPLMMELPQYHLPSPRNIALGLWQRVVIFVRRVGTIILSLTVLMGFLASFPTPPPGVAGAPIGLRGRQPRLGPQGPHRVRRLGLHAVGAARIARRDGDRRPWRGSLRRDLLARRHVAERDPGAARVRRPAARDLPRHAVAVRG